MIIIFLLFIGVVLLGAWILSPKIYWNAKDKDLQEQGRFQA